MAFQDSINASEAGGRAAHRIEIPADAIADASIGTLKLYAASSAHVIDGLDALLRCARLDQIGALFLLVDAIDQNAEQYYLRLGFRALPDQPSRLYFPLDDLRRSQRT